MKKLKVFVRCVTRHVEEFSLDLNRARKAEMITNDSVNSDYYLIIAHPTYMSFERDFKVPFTYIEDLVGELNNILEYGGEYRVPDNHVLGYARSIEFKGSDDLTEFKMEITHFDRPSSDPLYNTTITMAEWEFSAFVSELNNYNAALTAYLSSLEA